MRKNLFITLFLAFSIFSLQAQERILLNGKWLMGEKRKYISEVNVPGIHCNPTKMNEDTLWYKRKIVLPKGKWTYATLELKGARFAPEIFVDGVSVSRANGGMTSTFHLLKSKKVQAGKTITLEIALTSLKNLPKTDASYIPATDHWRSNISSSLWDDVVLLLHGEQRIGTVIPNANPATKSLSVDFYVENPTQSKKNSGDFTFNILDSKGSILLTQNGKYSSGKNAVSFNYQGKLKEWSPENPALYAMEILIAQNGKVVDKVSRKLGVRQFEIKDKQLYLNGNLFKFRGSSVTWHRWMRTPDGVKLGYDTTWFKENVIAQLKEHGANSVNFHLGPPPSSLLDLCDKYGILVRYEWNFFHGMPATKESCIEQYGSWMASSMNHPSINLYYPYNETDGKELKTAWSALDEVLKLYPPLVFSHRDIIHLHKYWWSLFENLGLSYDSYTQFGQTVIADEFGGNYLDTHGDEGGYPAVKETYLRFLGRGHTKEMRLKHHALSNAKIAEYWRRIGVAGWTPFTVLGSHEDGDNWYLGDLKEGNLMPVWNAMTAAWSPVSISLEMWDKNFLPAQQINVPLYFFNETTSDLTLKVKLTICDSRGKIHSEQYLDKVTPASSQIIENLTLNLPERGDYTIKAELLNRPAAIKYPIVSDWDIRIFRATVPNKVASAKIYTPDDETELKTFIENYGFKKAALPTEADIILLSTQSWNKIAKGEKEIKDKIETAINSGKSVVMLDAGNRSLGRSYPKKEGELIPMDATGTIKRPALVDIPLFGSIILRFKESAEAETHIFQSTKDKSLWNNLPSNYMGMWNGLRGNLMVPAWEMDIQGVNADLFLEQWVARGADKESISSGKSYYAYELHGYYEFSTIADDETTKKRLKDKVLQHIEDAPSLAVFLDMTVPIKATDVAAGYKNANTGMAKSLIIMANAGKNLTKTPVLLIEFGDRKGNLLISQLLTANRLTPHTTTGKLYDIRYDETTVQMVLNMIEKTLK